MAYQPKLGQGSANKNTRKQSDKSPDYRGDFVAPDGTRYNISLWEKQGRNGMFLSIAVSAYTPPPPKTPLEKALESFDDEIPF